MKGIYFSLVATILFTFPQGVAVAQEKNSATDGAITLKIIQPNIAQPIPGGEWARRCQDVAGTICCVAEGGAPNYGEPDQDNPHYEGCDFEPADPDLESVVHDCYEALVKECYDSFHPRQRMIDSAQN